MKTLFEKYKEQLETLPTTFDCPREDWCAAHGEGLYCHLDDEKENDENVIPKIKLEIKQSYLNAIDCMISELKTTYLPTRITNKLKKQRRFIKNHD